MKQYGFTLITKISFLVLLKAQEGPSEAAEYKEEEAQEKQESIAIENPSAESAVVDDSKHDGKCISSIVFIKLIVSLFV